MKHIRRKLNNQDGVSILIALVGFLAAAMISAVIVSAALTSAQRVANDKEENQAYLTLESAAQVIREGLKDTTCTVVTTTDDTGTVTETTTYSGTLAGALQANTPFSILPESCDAKYQTEVTLTKDEDNMLHFTLSVQGSSEKMYISAVASSGESGDVVTITWSVTSITHTWSDTSDAQGEAGE